MPKIIGYAYDADLHCSACAINEFAVSRIEHIEPAAYGYTHIFSDGDTEELDEHYIPLSSTDREGNQVRPIFSTDERDENACCGDCLSPL